MTETKTAEYLEFQAELLSETTENGDHEAEGLALPYGEVINRMHWETGARRQVWKEGSVKLRDDAKFYYGHDHQLGGMPIGRVLLHAETPAGARMRTRFAKTQKAEDVRSLMTPDKDGKAVLDRFSVGFYPVGGYLDTDGEFEGTETDPVYVHDEIDAFEVSTVDRPALKTAAVDEVLHEQDPTDPKQKEKIMTETLSQADIDTKFETLANSLGSLTENVENLDRRIATLGTGDGNKPTIVVPGNSYGEFIQMLAANDEAALGFLQQLSEQPELLAYTGGVIGDLGDWVKDSWVGDIYRPVIEKRRLHNLFSRTPLPSSGNNVEFGRLLADTTAVDEQVAEGDVLAYGKLTFDTATAPVKTYGGWADMSRQQIQRSGVGVVQFLFEALINRYAQATEVALRTVVANVANSHALAGAGVSDLTTSDGWTDFVIDASFWLDDKGLSPEFVLLGRDKFKAAAKIRVGDPADGTYMLDRKQGTMNVVGLTGEIFTLPVIPVNVNGLVRVGHSSAIRTFEDGAAPFRLQDSDITNLTDAFSIYGYEAIAVQDKDALVSPDVTA